MKNMSDKVMIGPVDGKKFEFMTPELRDDLKGAQLRFSAFVIEMTKASGQLFVRKS